jgi:hypothetical protein
VKSTIFVRLVVIVMSPTTASNSYKTSDLGVKSWPLSFITN